MKKLITTVILALFLCTSIASANELLGTGAGGAITTGADNTLIGDYAGERLTTGSGNTMLGTYVGRNFTTGRGNIIIGYIGGDAITATDNFKLSIATQYYPSYGIFGILSSGYIGINKVTPTVALDVTGAIAATGSISGTTITGSGAITGTTITGSGQMKIANADTVVISREALVTNATEADTNTVRIVAPKITWFDAVGETAEVTLDADSLKFSGATVTSIANGKVGIGTTGPGAKLAIKASAASGEQLYLIQSNDDRGWKFKVKTDGHLYLQSSYSGTDTDRLFVNHNSGNVGIGKTVPATLLDVAGGSITARANANGAGADSSIVVGTTTGNGSVAWYATDGDTYSQTINTSDQAVFSGASGGYNFDGPATIDSTLVSSHGTPWDLADSTYTGTVVIGQAGVATSFGDVCYLWSTGKYLKAQADSVASVPARVMCVQTSGIAADAYGKYLHTGYVKLSTWTTIGTVGANVFVDDDTAGLPTVTQPPDIGDQSQKIGYCIATDVMFFNPDYTVVTIP